MRYRAVVLPLVGLMVLLAGVAPVWAGHYELADCPEITTAEENARLVRQGIETTEQLLEAVAARKDRNRLARKTGISKKRLLWMAEFCDLLRIEGVGPIMARLLQATGIATVVALAREQPELLITRVSETNRKYGITDPPPTVEHMKSWIAHARTLPIIVK